MDKLKKLSQAIRLGATIHKQCTNMMWSQHTNGEWHTCAIGAAYFALHGEMTPPENSSIADSVAKRFCVPLSLLDSIMRMNDERRMTREAIADKLEAQGL